MHIRFYAHSLTMMHSYFILSRSTHTVCILHIYIGDSYMHVSVTYFHQLCRCVHELSELYIRHDLCQTHGASNIQRLNERERRQCETRRRCKTHSWQSGRGHDDNLILDNTFIMIHVDLQAVSHKGHTGSNTDTGAPPTKIQGVWTLLCIQDMCNVQL